MENDQNKKIGLKIHQLRKNNKMSMKRLGELVNLHESTISRYEKGEIMSLDIEKIKEFAEALDTTPAYLMGWEDNLEKKAEEFKPYTIETLKKIIDSYPELSYKSLATVCMNKRVQLDWTEKKVANLANVDLNDYLNFENNHHKLDINDVENILNTLELSISFVLGFMCAILSIENNKTNLFDL